MAQSRFPFFWIVLICFLVVVPAIVLRSAYFEEGTTIGIARNAFEDGHWLEPYRAGLRFVERPVLMSWLLGAVGLLTGTITDWMARIPPALSLLGGASLIYYFIRPYVTVAAGLFSALCFIVSPIVLVKVATAETDLFMSVIEFAGFVVFWDAARKGSPSFMRAITAGLILAVAGLVKGPQPLGFIFLGLGVFFLLRRRWVDFIRLGLVGLIPLAVTTAWYLHVYQPGDVRLWASHSRLNTVSFDIWLRHCGWFTLQTALNFLPGWPLLVPVAPKALRRPASERDELLAALILFAALGPGLLAMWPGAADRYAMPAILPTAAAAGLAYDALSASRPRFTAAASMILVVLLDYQIALNWLVMPLALPLFDRERYYGQFIAEAVALRPGPVYGETHAVNNNFFVYVPSPLREVPLDTIVTAPAPIWALIQPQDEERLRVLRPNVTIVVHIAGHSPWEWRLVDIRDK